MPVTPRVRELGPLLRERHGKVRKLCLRLPTRCPNRDGSLALDGCLYCAESQEPPNLSLEEQLAAGLAQVRGPLIAYLQSNTATAGISAEELARVLARLRAEPRVVAIHLGTRPDALPPPILALLADDARRGGLLVELGLQSASDETLRVCRRRHDVACFVSAVQALQARAIRVCAHVILGLPTPAATPEGPLPAEGAEEAAASARLLGELGVSAVKIHNAHVLRGTGLHALQQAGRYRPPELDEYLELLIAFLCELPAEVEVHRLLGEARPPLLIAPAFTAEKGRSLAFIRAELERRDLWQGSNRVAPVEELRLCDAYRGVAQSEED